MSSFITMLGGSNVASCEFGGSRRLITSACSHRASQNKVELGRWAEEMAQIKEAEQLRKQDASEFEAQRHQEEQRLLQETLAQRRRLAEEELAMLQSERSVVSKADSTLESQLEAALRQSKKEYEAQMQQRWEPVQSSLHQVSTVVSSAEEELEAVRSGELERAEEASIRQLLALGGGLRQGNAGTELPAALKQLEGMWQALDAQAGGGKFLEQVATEVGTTGIVQMVETEAHKLATRVPIMQAISRREALLQEDPAGHSAELANLERGLRELIPAYEAEHRERFMFEGHSYLESILSY